MSFFSVQVISCGTVLYPKRRGQKTGQIDVAVALMDGIGILFFVVPGVAAFVVDFYTGAIYLPPGSERAKKSADTEGTQGSHNWKTIIVNPKQLDAKTIERIVKDYTGKSLQLDADDLEIIAIEKPKDMMQVLTRLSMEHGITHANTREIVKPFSRNLQKLVER